MAMRAVQRPSPDEAELVVRALRKEPAAIRLIMQQHNQRLYRIARSIVRDDSEAEDVLQEAYAHAFTNLGTFRHEARLGTWLTRIVMNEAFGRLRRRRKAVQLDSVATNPAMEAQIIAFPHANPELDPEASLAQREIRALLEHAIDALPKAFRLVLVARSVEGMSVEETAQLLDILPQTVKTRLYRARRLLKHEMVKHIGPVLGDTFRFAGRRCERLTEKVLARLALT